MPQDGSTDADDKPSVIFAKVLAFVQHLNAARQVKKGDRVYIEGQLSTSIWRTADGEARIDVTIPGLQAERTGIGINRPPRDGRSIHSQAPIERREREMAFDDEIPF